MSQWRKRKILTIFLLIVIVIASGYTGYYFFIKYPNYKISDDVEYSSEIFTHGKEGYHTYRIPAILENPDTQTVLAFVEGRRDSTSDFGNIDLVLKRSLDGGRTWGSMITVWDFGEMPVQNPCPLYIDSKHMIQLHVLVNRTWHYVLNSTDDGLTWSKPTEILLRPEGMFISGPAPGHGLVSCSGRIIIPCMHNTLQNSRDGTWGSHLLLSDDKGETWRMGAIFPNQTNECLACETSNGSILTILRPNQDLKANYITYSPDGGETSTDLEIKSELISPICQVGIIQNLNETAGIPSYILHSGPKSTEKRHQLTLTLSLNNGNSWEISRELYHGLSGYSDLVILHDDTIGCIFEGGRYDYRASIKYACLTYEWINSS